MHCKNELKFIWICQYALEKSLKIDVRFMSLLLLYREQTSAKKKRKMFLQLWIMQALYCSYDQTRNAGGLGPPLAHVRANTC